MRRATVVGLMGLAMVVLSAGPAWAQWEWFKWIQELSGPGPFHLDGATITFGCRKVNAEDRLATVVPDLPGVVRVIQCDRAPREWSDVRTFMSVTVAQGQGENNLEYPASREKLAHVSAWMFRFAGTIRLNQVLDVGSGAGMFRFSGTPDVFTMKGFIEPFISLRPFGGLARPEAKTRKEDILDGLARSIDVTYAMTVFPRGFYLTDFGAIGGADLNGDREFLQRFGIRVLLSY